ncbi:competence/damage-inducible protein A [bacterium]|nr:competence/damage-inducible protein A [bacterium]
MTPVIEIIVVGNEILSGRTIDCNAAYLIDTLMKAGFPVRHVSVVGDYIPDISVAFRTALERSDVTLATGGLGPTSDDVTVQALAEAFGRELVLDEEVLGRIEALFRRRKWFMSESNKKQALIPTGAVPLVNPIGTAPGISLELNGHVVYLMPGVPNEMRLMFDQEVLPLIRDGYESSKAETATVHVTGISESGLYERIGILPGAREAFSYYPGPEGIAVVIRTEENAPMSASALSDEIVAILGDLVYSTGGESMEKVVGDMLVGNGLTIGIAESCTGGLVTHRLTNVPGSSAYLLAGLVTYSNESKCSVLGVDPGLIGSHGAVSAEVAGAMAEGVRNVTGADIGLSTTGIAGPGGGSDEKPVGLLYAGISTVYGTETKKLQFVVDRLINKSRMSQAVLDILRLHLKKR